MKCLNLALSHYGNYRCGAPFHNMCYFRHHPKSQFVNIEPLITRYVYENKTLSLHGIGTIKLEDAVPDAEYLSKHKDIPVTGLHFEWKPGVATSPEFVKYYSEHRGKIASLADSDIQADLEMAVQFLNIGNPFELKGLGTINKINNGSLVMTPGHFIALKEEEATNRFRDRQSPEQDNEEDKIFGRKEQPSSGPRKLVIALIVTVAVLIGAWWIYSSFIQSKNENANNGEQVQDTLVVPQTSAIDTITKRDTTLAPAVVISNDSTTVKKWKAVFREENEKSNALKIFGNYQKIKSQVLMETTDSLSFRYYVILESALMDTARKVDSLQKFFARPVKLFPMQ